MRKSFYIKEKKWTLCLVPDDSPKLIMDGEKCLGQIFFRTKKIYLSEELKKDEDSFKDTIIHELTHAFIFTYAIDRRTFQDEEFICEFMAVYGLDIIRIADMLFRAFLDKYKSQDFVL